MDSAWAFLSTFMAHQCPSTLDPPATWPPCPSKSASFLLESQLFSFPHLTLFLTFRYEFKYHLLWDTFFDLKLLGNNL